MELSCNFSEASPEYSCLDICGLTKFERSQLYSGDYVERACHRFETQVRCPQSTKRCNVS